MLPVDAKQIPALFQKARAAQAKGDFAGARAQYSAILAVRPKLAEVHFNLAQISLAEGHKEAAFAAFGRAAALKPAEGAIWAAWKASCSADQSAMAGILRAMIATRQFVQAEELALQLTRADSKDAFGAMMLGAARAELGKSGAAEKAFKTAVRLDKSSAEAQGRYGTFLVNTGRAALGVPLLQKAVALAPDDPQPQLNLGWAAFQAGDVEAAGAAFEAARGLGGASAALWSGLGRVALAQKDDRAVEYFAKSLDVGGPSVERHMHHAAALRAARRDAEALAAYDAALALSPQTAGIMAEKAMMLQNLGDMEGARAMLGDALALDPENGSLYLLYVSTGKIEAVDPVAMKARALYDAGHNDRYLAFAIAKLDENVGVSGFPALNRGNRLLRAAFPYDFKADARQAEALRRAYQTRDVTAWTAAGDPEPAPIFVTGLPRSGTTLIEQIIAAHSEVASAGEVGILGRLLGDLKQPPDMERLVARYWRVLQARFEGAGRITDKSISTYTHIGFIKALLPNAKIVVVQRDPRDTAVSLYKNMFADGQHRYANDLGDIARFTRLHETQVAFWEAEAPGSFTTARYEDFITDPEGASRRLIADVGLEWEEACLSFYTSGARVDTLSNVQVRQPIYASSVGVWRKHEEALAPFLETYGSVE